jgi:hypothetical protein
MVNITNAVAYGLSSPLVAVPPKAIPSLRNPGTGDKAQVGQLWVNLSTNAYFVLTSISNNSATWVASSGGGGAGVFASVEATTGNITADLGNFVATAGNITATAGNIVATAGNITANGNAAVIAAIGTAGTVKATILEATGDGGTGSAGTTQITNAVDTTQGAGALTILSPSATSHTNTGLLKIYIGATAAYIPYFENIS